MLNCANPVLTAPADYDWVCDKANYPVDILTAANVGSVVSSLTFGPLADTYGIRVMTLSTNRNTVIFPFLKAWASIDILPHNQHSNLLRSSLAGGPKLHLVLNSRVYWKDFISNLISSTLSQRYTRLYRETTATTKMCYDFAVLEQVSPEKRGKIGAMVNIWWVGGVVALSGLAWLVRGNWRYLALIGTLPYILCFCLWK